MPIRFYDIHILGMKSKDIPDDKIDMGEFIRDIMKDFPGSKGGGSARHAEMVIPNQVEFICDTCEKKLKKGDWFCVQHSTGKLWCKICWDKKMLTESDGKTTGLHPVEGSSILPASTKNGR